MKKRLSLIVLLIMMVILVAGCGGQTQQPDSGEPAKTTYIKFATSTMGGTWFPVAAAMCEIINSNVENTVATATLGAADANILNIEDGTILMAFTTSDALAAAAKAARKPFEQPVEKVRALAAVYETPIQIATPVDSGITSINDIIGKRVNAFIVGGSLEVTVKNIFENHGVSYEDIKAAGGTVSHVGYDEQIMLTKDRLLDVSVYMTPAPSQQIVDIETVRPMTLIKLDPGVLDKIVSESPEYAKTVVPAGTYKGLAEDAATISVVHLVIVSESLPDDLVYEITKAIFENAEAIGAVHPVVKKELSINNATKGLPVPLHPGAEKYYKEKGL